MIFFLIAASFLFETYFMTSFDNMHAKTFWPDSELHVTWKSNIYKREDESGKADSPNNFVENSNQNYEYWPKKLFRIIC